MCHVFINAKKAQQKKSSRQHTFLSFFLSHSFFRCFSFCHLLLCCICCDCEYNVSINVGMCVCIIHQRIHIQFAHLLYFFYISLRREQKKSGRKTRVREEKRASNQTHFSPTFPSNFIRESFFSFFAFSRLSFGYYMLYNLFGYCVMEQYHNNNNKNWAEMDGAGTHNTVHNNTILK